ncbi:MAG TPA: class I SAM-dependent methyltransferase [Methylomirabilota bacterium]|jgi:predicted O-methyltransferase YrrM|nr:class I SAM-dependent methyltransferase [Methylomirabilota bacterium]
MTKTAERMLRLMDRAVTEWRLPVLGKQKSSLMRRLLVRHKPRRGIEVGSLFGYSAILIGSSLPRGGRLTCIEANPFLAEIVKWNVAEAGLAGRVKVMAGDALRVLPRLRGPVDFLLIDAKKDDYLRYLRAVEPRLTKGALVVADNTGIYRRETANYLAHVRNRRYTSREHDFGFDCMEVSVYRG